jgi:sec-independent protein translocase protein TatA
MAGAMIVATAATWAFLDRIGWGEWVLILLVVLLLFGGKKLPDLARGLARGLRIFKNELEGAKKDIEEPPAEDKEQKEQKVQKDQDTGKTDQNKDA